MGDAKTELSVGEMYIFMMGYGIDREEKPNRPEDLIDQTWHLNPERLIYELVEEKEGGK